MSPWSLQWLAWGVEGAGSRAGAWQGAEKEAGQGAGHRAEQGAGQGGKRAGTVSASFPPR
jgi:hypothetical protein